MPMVDQRHLVDAAAADADIEFLSPAYHSQIMRLEKSRNVVARGIEVVGPVRTTLCQPLRRSHWREIHFAPPRLIGTPRFAHRLPGTPISSPARNT